MSKQVEKIRDLRFDKPVEASFLTKAQVEKRVGELFLEDYSKRDADLEGRVLEALGAIPRGSDLFNDRKRLLEGQVAGFYVPETEELVVLAEDQVGPLERVSLSHELEHALADQNLDLPLPERSNPETADADLATLAVVEGDATLTMQRWALANLSITDQLSMLSGSPQLQQSQEDLEAMPHFIQQQLSFPYLDGLGFVCALEREGGWAAVDKAYDEPPASTDQVLFPERYDPKAEPIDPADTGEPGTGWTSSLTGSFGAAELKWLFEAPGGDPAAAIADPLESAGAWGGGELELWTDGDASALGVALAQRQGSDGLCESITEWYSASFSDDDESTEGDAALVAEGGEQDAVITCSGDDVKIGIGPVWTSPAPWRARSSTAEALVAAYGQRQRDQDDQQRPHDRHHHRVLCDPRPSTGRSRVTEKIARRGNRGRDRVPLRDRAKPVGHQLGIDERVGKHRHGKEQPPHRTERLWRFHDEADVDAYPQECEAKQQQQTDRKQRVAESLVPSPTHHETASDHHDQSGRGVQHIGRVPANDDRGLRHRQGPEPVRDSLIGVGVHGDHRLADPEGHGLREETRHQKVDVAAPFGSDHSAAEHIAEEQDEDDRENQTGDDLSRLMGPVRQIPVGDRPAVFQRPLQASGRSLRM